MGRIVVTEFLSLDGVMEAPGGEDFKYPGWSFEFDRGDDGNQFKLDEAFDAEALLLGRVTYESFADAWPEREGEFADKFNEMPKYVVSSTLSDPEWNNTTVLEGDVTEAVSRLRDELDGNIYIHGSRQLVQDAARGRPRRRAAADGLPGRARHRPAPVRRDQRQARPEAERVEDRRRRCRDPGLRARLSRRGRPAGRRRAAASRRARARSGSWGPAPYSPRRHVPERRQLPADRPPRRPGEPCAAAARAFASTTAPIATVSSPKPTPAA